MKLIEAVHHSDGTISLKKTNLKEIAMTEEALMSLIEELEDLIGPRLKHKVGTPDRWEEYEKILDICKRLRVLSPKGIDENIIIGACNLLDTIKSEWGDQWSEWDQSIRDGLSQTLKSKAATRLEEA